MLRIQNARIWQSGRLVEGDVWLDGGRILHVAGQPSEPLEADLTLNACGNLLLPGMLDAHMHGAAGVDVNDATVSGYEQISKYLASQGTTGFLCSILTDTEEKTLWCIQQAVEAQRKGLPGAQLLGIHLEGPFLSAAYKGAMPETLLKKGDPALMERYQQAAEGTIRYITVAPEVEGVLPMIQAMTPAVRVAVGHSEADYATAMKAFACGAVSVTHTFNAMRLFHQHEPSVMGAALESDVYCEAICDGRHLHPGSVRLLLKCKGYDRVVAVTDSIMAAGLPDGQYKLGVNDVTVIDGDARLTENGVRAGSTLTQQQALQKLMDFTGQPVEAVIPLLSQNPARMLGFRSKGDIRPGMDADLTLTDAQGYVLCTLVQGRPVYLKEEGVEIHASGSHESDS